MPDPRWKPNQDLLDEYEAARRSCYEVTEGNIFAHHVEVHGGFLFGPVRAADVLRTHRPLPKVGEDAVADE